MLRDTLMAELIEVTIPAREAEPGQVAQALHAAMTRLRVGTRAEVWVDLDPFPALCALFSGEHAVLMVVRYSGDPGFTSRNPAYRGRAEATFSYTLSNGQVDEFPAAWAYSRQQAMEVIEEFAATRRVPESVSWFNDSGDGAAPNDESWRNQSPEDR